jgi:2-methylaconitate cis-trans-isomerase PrpF
MTELEHLHAAVDAFLDFLGVTPGAKEERLWNARRRVLDAIESGVRRGTGIALAMVEVSVEADLIGVDGFPMGEELHRHEDLVARYGPAREAVAAHVPAVEVLVRLPPH